MKVIKTFRVILWANGTISGYDENDNRVPEEINRAFAKYFESGQWLKKPEVN